MLRVLGAFVEDGRAITRVAGALAGELRVMADWLGLADVTVSGNGELAPELRRCLRGCEQPVDASGSGESHADGSVDVIC